MESRKLKNTSRGFRVILSREKRTCVAICVCGMEQMHNDFEGKKYSVNNAHIETCFLFQPVQHGIDNHENAY